MTSLARRAFRRPCRRRGDRQLRRRSCSGKRSRRNSRSRKASCRDFQALLVSPDFLFRIERDRRLAPAATSHRISQHELATRLSYFLWSSMPDDGLRRAADAGTLRNPVVLAARSGAC